MIAFDTDRAARLLHRLAFPRAVGSRGEALAARLVGRAMARAGRPVVRERFPVGTAARRFGVLPASIGAMALVGMGLAALPGWPEIATACFLAAGYAVNAPWIVARSPAEPRRSRVWSENLVSWPVEDAGGPSPSRVVFLAHYDSKSQRLPTGARVALVVLATSGCLVLALIGAVEAAVPGLIGVVPAAGGAALVGVAVAALMFNTSGNRSPGAIDNASGLAVMLELARSWRPRDGVPVEVAFVATGAEEVGLDGARAFLRRHEWWLRERPTLLINLESVGAGARVWLAGSNQAVAMAGRVADLLGMPTGRLRVLGAGMDHEPFAAAGLDAVSLLGDVVANSFAFHTPNDGVRLIDRDALVRAGSLASHLARAWAGRHRLDPSGADEAGPLGVTPIGA
ncbi:M28 family metallopeptidase [Tautonia plasticadhaerens]|uniref:Aminopeptidase YwaD n=1 Tax=Tautonia plasticadhaerens TaxID=2527974 RepID=A0A518GVB6_9BACT|nr:M28 family peptidase [Tautonia plasticadhaerens]QDV32535.1 Aminopeptidase YwaD precursor [Tautonia plasticadhaerens]